MRFSIDTNPAGGFDISSPDLPDWHLRSRGGPALAEAIVTGMRAHMRRDGTTAGTWETETRPAAAATSSNDVVEQLPLSRLIIDPTYQRPLDTRRVAKMAADYDPALIGVLEVSRRPDGTYAVIDGQHRWALLLDVADDGTDPTVACKVHHDLTVDDEAALFFDIDASRRKLTGWDRWTARRGAGDPVVVEIEAAVHACGLRTSEYRTPGGVSSTVALETVYDLGGTELLTECLQLVLNVWRDDPDALSRAVIEGFAYLLTGYPREQLDLSRLITQLQPLTVRQFGSRISAKRERTPGSNSRLAAAVMVDEYNKADRAGRLDGSVLRDAALSRPKLPGGAPAVVTRQCTDCGQQLVKKHRAGRWPTYCPECRDQRRAGKTASAA